MTPWHDNRAKMVQRLSNHTIYRDGFRRALGRHALVVESDANHDLFVNKHDVQHFWMFEGVGDGSKLFVLRNKNTLFEARIGLIAFFALDAADNNHPQEKLWPVKFGLKDWVLRLDREKKYKAKILEEYFIIKPEDLPKGSVFYRGATKPRQKEIISAS